MISMHAPANLVSRMYSTIMTDLRVATVAATGVIATGVSSSLQWIPDDIGKLGALAGVLLSLVLAVTHTFNCIGRWRRTAAQTAAIRRGEIDPELTSEDLEDQLAHRASGHRKLRESARHKRVG